MTAPSGAAAEGAGKPREAGDPLSDPPGLWRTPQNPKPIRCDNSAAAATVRSASSGSRSALSR